MVLELVHVLVLEDLVPVVLEPVSEMVSESVSGSVSKLVSEWVLEEGVLELVPVLLVLRLLKIQHHSGHGT